jgi:hypothetical protein
MNELIEKNKRSFRFCCGAVQIIGVLLIVMGVVWFILVVSRSEVSLIRLHGKASESAVDDFESIQYILTVASWLVFGFMVPGLAAVGIAQFAGYLFAKEGQPAFVIRHGHIFFYTLGGFEIFWAYFRYALFINLIEDSYARVLWTQPLLLPTLAKVLLLIGLGQILKRILPVIEESKTLV